MSLDLFAGIRVSRALHTNFVADLDTLVAQIVSRGIQPDERVTYPARRPEHHS
ncbi:MAG TPA: hypothetical protein VGO80_19620 [Solirubrobacteraceae bacterium]|jgi:hypothetical protein|nr:hypothetical protein [Solirubrobacteraceae bacterium]